MALVVSVSPRDRVFLYGDGLFETIVVVDGRPLWLDLHLQRLRDGALRLRIPFSKPGLLKFLDEQLEEAGASSYVLRLTLSRGESARGYTPPVNPVPSYIASISPLPHSPRESAPPLTLARSDVELAEQPTLAGLKHCNRLEQVLGALDAREKRTDDVLMGTANGLVQCTTRHNVFVVHNGAVLTPCCDRSGVKGTRRQLLMQQLADELEIAVTEDAIHFDDLDRVDGMFVTNAIDGIRSVASFNGQAFEQLVLVDALQRAYFRAMDACLER